MSFSEIETLLEIKKACLNKVYLLALEENVLVKAKEFGKILDIDLKKNEAIKGLLDMDKEILKYTGDNPATTENVQLIIENINSSLNDLIKLEKENELLLGQTADFFSGNYINAYKTYKQCK
jgi:hypothetical protein